MSGLKGAKTISVGNGSADYFHIGECSVNQLSLGGDMKIHGDTSLLTVLKTLQDEIAKLKLDISEIKSKMDSLEIE